MIRNIPCISTTKYVFRLAIAVFLSSLLVNCSTESGSPQAALSVPKIELVGNVRTEYQTVRTEEIDQNNCGGKADTGSTVARTRTVERTIEWGNEVTVDAGGQVGLFGTQVNVGGSIAANLGYTYGSSESLQRQIDVHAPPGTHMMHQVNHREVWDVGEVRVEVGQQSQVLPFRFRRDFDLQLADSFDIGCSSTPSHTRTASPSPTATNDPAPALTRTATSLPTSTHIATLRPTPTQTATPHPTSTPTVPPPPTPCAIAVDANIQPYWRQDIGCPTESMHITWASFTPYERGFVIWRSDDRLIYGFFDGVGWAKDQDRFVEGMPDRPTPNRGEPPSGLFAPIRGTGLVWETNDVFYRNLGWVRIQQKGFCVEVQNFVNGFILRSSGVGSCTDSKSGQTLSSRANESDFEFRYVIAYNSGRWLP